MDAQSLISDAGQFQKSEIETAQAYQILLTLAAEREITELKRDHKKGLFVPKDEFDAAVEALDKSEKDIKKLMKNSAEWREYLILIIKKLKIDPEFDYIDKCGSLSLLNDQAMLERLVKLRKDPDLQD